MEQFDEADEWTGPFDEWCQLNGGADPQEIIKYFQSVIDDYRTSEIWDAMNLSKTMGVEKIDELLDVFKNNGDVSESGMMLIQILIETILSMVRYTKVLESDWILTYDEDIRDVIAVGASMCMSVEDMKNEICEINCGPADLQPIMFYQYEDAESVTGVGTARLPIGTEADYVGMVSRTLNRALLEFGKPITVSIVSDSYVQPGPAVKKFANTTELADDFKTNPSSRVSEALIVMLFTSLGQMVFFNSIYWYGDDGLPVFDNDKRSIEVPDIAMLMSDGSEKGRIGVVINAFMAENSSK